MANYVELRVETIREMMEYIFLLFKEEKNIFINFDCRQTKEGFLFCSLNNRATEKNKVSFSSMGAINMIQQRWSVYQREEKIRAIEFAALKESKDGDLKIFAIFY